MALKEQILRRPTRDVLTGWKQQAAQAADPSAVGVPVKKGKVKRRKHGD
jgi:hypothetical protein